MTAIEHFRLGCALVIVLGFFMPWVSRMGSSVEGYKIAQFTGGFIGLQEVLAGQADPRILIFYSPYLILILALAAVGYALTVPAGSAKASPVGVIAGIAPFVVLVLAVSLFGDDLFQVLTFGGYITLAAAGALLYVSLLSDPETETRQAESEPT